jgi:hypothetical protein
LPPDRQDIPIRREGSASARRINALKDTCFQNRREGMCPKKKLRALSSAQPLDVVDNLGKDQYL